MAPLVSIIIPAFNASKYLGDTLQSAFSQTTKSLEIIVVDDGSADGTVDIVRSCKDERLVLIEQKHAGACAARNTGFNRSNGSLIQFLDADDILCANKVEAQVKCLLSLKNWQTKISHCNLQRFKGKNIHAATKKEPHKSIRQNMQPVEWLIANRPTVTGCWLAPRALIEKAGLWNETLKQNQDDEFFSRLVANAGEVLFCNEAKVYYRIDSLNSISKNRSRDAAASRLKAIELVEQHILQLKDSAQTRKATANKYLEFIYLNLIIYPDLAAVAEEHILRLGGADKLPGGAILKTLSTLLGWKKAMSIKKLFKFQACSEQEYA